MLPLNYLLIMLLLIIPKFYNQHIFFMQFLTCVKEIPVIMEVSVYKLALITSVSVHTVIKE